MVTSSGGYLNAIAQRGAREVEPEPALHRDLVDLDDDAVDLVLDVVPVLAVVGDVALHAGQVVDDPEPVADRQAPAAQRLVGLGLPRRREALARADAVHDHAQRPATR